VGRHAPGPSVWCQQDVCGQGRGSSACGAEPRASGKAGEDRRKEDSGDLFSATQRSVGVAFPVRSHSRALWTLSWSAGHAVRRACRLPTCGCLVVAEGTGVRRGAGVRVEGLCALEPELRDAGLAEQILESAETSSSVELGAGEVAGGGEDSCGNDDRVQMREERAQGRATGPVSAGRSRRPARRSPRPGVRG
jgi:hypothetical protein